MQVISDTTDVPTQDGTADAFLSRPVEGGPFPPVLVYMDAFGLRPRLREMAERIAAAGYVVLVPNVFYRSGRAPVVEIEDLRNPESRSAIFEKLRPIMTILTPELAVRDAASYLAYLASLENVADGPVGTVGYCMGGALSLRTAAAYPDRVAAAGSFHGGNLATDAEYSPHRQVAKICGEVYVGHADQDHSMPPEQMRRLDEALRAAGVCHVTELYKGAAHGFTMADTAAYDEEAAERHFDRLLDLLDRNLARPQRLGSKP
jgi:carboxymethylenebutenolidase